MGKILQVAYFSKMFEHLIIVLLFVYLWEYFSAHIVYNGTYNDTNNICGGSNKNSTIYKFWHPNPLKFDIHRKYRHSDEDTHGSLFHCIFLYSIFFGNVYWIFHIQMSKSISFFYLIQNNRKIKPVLFLLRFDYQSD